MDFLTLCLQNDEATVITILKDAPFKHTYAQTFGPFVNEELILQVYKGGTVSEVGDWTRMATKLLFTPERPRREIQPATS
jgi:hypothetical protein